VKNNLEMFFFLSHKGILRHTPHEQQPFSFVMIKLGKSQFIFPLRKSSFS
jgi:hypothetical protein